MKKQLLNIFISLFVLSASESVMAKKVTGIVSKIDAASRQIVINKQSYRLALSATISFASDIKGNIDLIESKSIVEARFKEETGDIIELIVIESP